MKQFLFSILTFIALAFGGLAQAADPFTVAGVPVDATGSSAIEAQTFAIQDGQLRAAQLLIERLTLSVERASQTLAPIDIDTAAKMIRGLEIANEKRSSNRYLGDITVAFNPSAVQSYLKQGGLNMISSQSRERLVLPLVNGQLDVESPWFTSWSQGGYNHALTPVKALSAEQAVAITYLAPQIAQADAQTLKQIGAQFGVQQILVADQINGFAGTDTRAIDVGLDSGAQESFTIGWNDPASANPNQAIVTRLEDGWKSAAANVAQNAVTMAVSVLYSNHAEWVGLKDAIDSAAQIQGARLDALSKDGALMTVTYGGDLARLSNELSFKGVELRNDPKLGVVLARSGRF